MKDFESLTVISIENYCKVNPVCLKCLKMINSLKHKKFRKVIKDSLLYSVILF